MPTYTVYHRQGSLEQGQKDDIARRVTEIHRDLAKAASYFAEVLFVSVEPVDWYVGGVRTDGPQIFVLGRIREGRTTAVKQQMIHRIIDEVSLSAGVPTERVWVYLNDYKAELMAEFGVILPRPGGERAWTESLPPEAKRLIAHIGNRSEP